MYVPVTIDKLMITDWGLQNIFTNDTLADIGLTGAETHNT